jgi:outer membrane protein assembly factor BamB
VYSSPVLGPDDTLYVGSSDHYLYALGLDGVLKWRYQTQGRISSSAVIGPDGSIYVGSCDQCLHALDTRGQLLWKYTLGGKIFATPVLASDGTLYVASTAGQVVAIRVTIPWDFQRRTLEPRKAL